MRILVDVVLVRRRRLWSISVGRAAVLDGFGVSPVGRHADVRSGYDRFIFIRGDSLVALDRAFPPDVLSHG
ncbi:hypothetical protein A5791_02740 [Mycobacterium sp. 852002-51163_SCH5372311]|nr:hypothetical protein A5791_02740 [Mycobacterium sp. 852002-51163_SCH5372311]